MKIKFSSYDSELVVLVVVIAFNFGNQKGCLMKILQLLIQVIINSIENLGFLVIKQKENLMEDVSNKIKLHTIMEKH